MQQNQLQVYIVYDAHRPPFGYNFINHLLHIKSWDSYHPLKHTHRQTQMHNASFTPTGCVCYPIYLCINSFIHKKTPLLLAKRVRKCWRRKKYSHTNINTHTHTKYIPHQKFLYTKRWSSSVTQHENQNKKFKRKGEWISIQMDGV